MRAAPIKLLSLFVRWSTPKEATRMMRLRVVGVLAALLVLVVGGCQSSDEASPKRVTSASSESTAPTPSTAPSASVNSAATERWPATNLPKRPCEAAIYSGVDPATVARQPSDLVVGPARFHTLLDAAKGIGVGAVAGIGRTLLDGKFPLTLTGIDEPYVVIGIETPDDSAHLEYANPGLTAAQDQFGAGTTVAALPTATACGDGVDGFVQYAGGIVATHPVCVTLTARTPDNQILDQAQVPFGDASC